MGKKNLVLEYLRNEEMDKEKQKLAEEYNLDKENIIIPREKVSIWKRILNFLSFFFRRVGKAIFYIIVFILVTIGATVLFNESLRNQIVSIFTQNM